MGRVRTAVQRLALGVGILSLAACSPVYRDHGDVPSEIELEEVVVGESTQEDVALAVGRPSSSGVLAGGAWYYVGSRFRQFGVRAPKEIEREVVAISFSEDGVVENVERFGLEDGRVVALSRRVTEPNIRGLGVIRQLLGNIGKLNAGSILGPRT